MPYSTRDENHLRVSSIAPVRVACCPFSRHAVACRGTTCGKTSLGIFHGMPRNLPRTSTAYHGVTLPLPLTLSLGAVNTRVPWE